MATMELQSSKLLACAHDATQKKGRMGLTRIQWCTYTWNPWRGCRKVSPGCEHCYIDRTPIFRITKQKHTDRVKGSEATLHAPFKWNRKPWICDGCAAAVSDKITHMVDRPACEQWCTPSGPPENRVMLLPFHRARVFLGSLMDIFDDEIPIEWFADALDTVRQCAELDWLLVSKRPELWKERTARVMNLQSGQEASTENFDFVQWLNGWLSGNRVPKNVWVITSAENQEYLEKRVPELLKIPAVVHGISAEPLLGPLDLSQVARTLWCIVGGESGPNARPCNVEWLRSIQAQCKAAGVAYFCKQLGHNVVFDDPGEPGGISSPGKLKNKKGGDPSEWPEDMRVRQWPEVRR